MIMRVKTIHGKEYTIPVTNSRHAAKVLVNLQRLGILCKWWKYEEGEVKKECSQVG